MPRFAVSTVAMLAVASAVGCGSSTPSAHGGATLPSYLGPPVPLQVDAPFFVPGETMKWQLSLYSIVGGEAMMATGQPGIMDGRRVIIVKSRVRSSGVLKMVKTIRDEVSTWIHLDDASPRNSEADLKFGDKETRIATTWDTNRFDMKYRRKDQPERRHLRSIPAGEKLYDAHSVLGILRAWEAEDGTRAYFNILSGRRLWRNDIRFAGRETLKTKMGVFPTIRLDGIGTRLDGRFMMDTTKEARSYTIWISDDANRMVLMVKAHTEYGDVKVELTDYQRPDRTIVRR